MDTNTKNALEAMAAEVKEMKKRVSILEDAVKSSNKRKNVVKSKNGSNNIPNNNRRD